MDANEIKEEILKVMDVFGMTGNKASEIMGVPYAQFRKKINGIPGRNFTEQNLIDLINYIKNKSTTI